MLAGSIEWNLERQTWWTIAEADGSFDSFGHSHDGDWDMVLTFGTFGEVIGTSVWRSSVNG